MSKVTTEQALLAFVGKVKNDPSLSRNTCAALDELEVALDPKAGEPKPKASTGTSSGRRRSSSGSKGKRGAGKSGTQGG